MSQISNYTSLLSGIRYNGMTAEGAAVFVSYAFVETSEVPSQSEYSAYANDGFSALTALGRQAFREALTLFESVSGIRFIEVNDSSDAAIRIMNTSGSQWGAWADYLAASKGGSSHSYLVIDTSNVGVDFTPGGYAFYTILHELGHVMGLKHPFDGKVTLSPALDNDTNTVMSYTHSDKNYPIALASMDVEALQSYYGAASNVSDQWSWAWSSATQTFSLNGSAFNDRLIGIDARSSINGMDGNDKIWGRDQSDKLDGSSGNDVLSGGSGKDVLIGGCGFDKLTGGRGADCFVFNDVIDIGKKNGQRDVIKDVGGRDIIDLSAIDANGSKKGAKSFVFLKKEGEPFTEAGQLGFDQKKGKTFVCGDTDGNGKANFKIEVAGTIDFMKSDFVL